MSAKRKLRTCCESHGDTCLFGRDHLWVSPWFNPSSGPIVASVRPGHHDSMLCANCSGICVGDMEEGASS